MFGYVTVNRPEMKVKEFERYRAFYCGLCHELRAVYGPIGQATLTSDMTFLVILLTGLYEPKTEESEMKGSEIANKRREGTVRASDNRRTPIGSAKANRSPAASVPHVTA